MRVNDEDVEDDGTGIAVYEGRPFTGETVETNKDGRILAIVQYKNGLEDGPWLQWFPNGQKKVEGQTSRGGPIGTWIEWHKNGQMAEKRIFNENRKTISHKQWNEEGEMTKDV
ncbi:toxin-antitoxin system YwqK family antitoxin [Streptomonospora litoralis]|uniref:Antitoxin YwqK n=1 Tax=Streptomonospora litoralis TaxID=2498135 RepID=A0A4P6Q1X8_9ACTN|nr:hypothetical protein [Streptomonospora litoralis]QBI54130.1 Putative antitoxin YwqK [Streptomonospora litoralis]